MWQELQFAGWLARSETRLNEKTLLCRRPCFESASRDGNLTTLTILHTMSLNEHSLPPALVSQFTETIASDVPQPVRSMARRSNPYARTNSWP